MWGFPEIQGEIALCQRSKYFGRGAGSIFESGVYGADGKAALIALV